MHGNMSIQNRNIVQIAVICNTLSPFHLAPDLFCRGEAPQARVSDLLWCYHSPEPGHWSGRGSLQSLITIHTLQSQQTGQLQESQHLLASFIPSVTRRLSRCKPASHASSSLSWSRVIDQMWLGVRRWGCVWWLTSDIPWTETHGRQREWQSQTVNE